MISDGNGQDCLSRYQEMAQMMYRLRRMVPHWWILGISTVHPRFPVPQDHLQLMEALQVSQRQRRAPAVPSSARLIAQWLVSLLYAVRESLQILFLKARFAPFVGRLKKEPADLLIKSWCFGPKTAGGSGDFYYGTLGEKLQERGVRPLFLSGDARGRMTRKVAQQLIRNEKIRSVPEPLLLPVWAPLAAVWKQIRGALAIRRLARETDDPQFSALCGAAASNGVRPATLRHTLYFYIAREAVKAFRPKALVTLYEGQPWEKLAWHGAREGSPRCRIVGYQHTVVMPHAISLLSPNRHSWELSVPDAVLCLGETTREMLSRGHAPFGTDLVTFGSFRERGERIGRSTPQPGRRTVLVLPMGVLDEAVALFDFAIQLARSVPEERFILRCHPVLPFSQVRPHLAQGPEGCANIEVSTAPEIAADFGRSSAALYHGSSAVLYAVLHGLRPLYLRTAALPDADPLFELQEWRVPVSSLEDAKRDLEAYAGLSAQQADLAWRKAYDYVQRYTKSVDDLSVDRFLAAVGMGQGVPS